MTFKEFKNAYDTMWNESESALINTEFMTQYCPSVDISGTNKILWGNILYAVWWFQENGFRASIIKNNTSGSEFAVVKDDVRDRFKLTATKNNPDKNNIVEYMEQFKKSFDMLCEIQELKAKLQSQKSV